MDLVEDQGEGAESDLRAQGDHEAVDGLAAERRQVKRDRWGGRARLGVWLRGRRNDV
jgi:hypothetical protein